MGLRDGSAVGRIYCSYTAPQFGSQRLNEAAHDRLYLQAPGHFHNVFRSPKTPTSTVNTLAGRHTRKRALKYKPILERKKLGLKTLKRTDNLVALRNVQCSDGIAINIIKVYCHPKLKMNRESQLKQHLSFSRAATEAPQVEFMGSYV